ncbi:MAG: hypothetical protein AAF567_24790, partial [Actinomycetota bacterium]
MKLKALLAVLLALAMFAVACGGSDDGGSGDDAASDVADAVEDSDDGGDSDSGSDNADDSSASGSDDDSGAASPSAGGLDIDAILAADADCGSAPEGDPIRVGMAMDFSDVVGFVDIPGSNLVPYVADKINCNGGINGSPVEVRVAEVGDDAALAAQDLLDWGAHFLIGPPFADFAL